MSNFRKCITCSEYDWMDRHKCPPAWLVYLLDGWNSADEEEVIYARDAEQAAIRFAKRFDWSDAEGLFLEEESEVSVRKDSQTTAQVFIVAGELVPHYEACLKEMPGDIKQ